MIEKKSVVHARQTSKPANGTMVSSGKPEPYEGSYAPYGETCPL